MKTFTAIAAAVLMTAGSAHAQQARDIDTVRVSYADLDLASAAGRSALERRVTNAVRRVCPDRPLPQETTKLRLYKACQEKAWDGVRPQMAALYNGRQLAEAAIRIGGN